MFRYSVSLDSNTSFSVILKMGQKNSFSFFWFVLISLGLASAQRCTNTGFFRPNSTFGTNRGLILASLASNVTAQGGFYNGSVGQDPDRVYAMSTCIPGADQKACSDCIQSVSEDLMQKCPNQTEAFNWSGDETLCLVRYSNHSFFGSLDMEPSIRLYNIGNITSNQSEFDKIWEGLMIRTIAAASSGTSSSKLKYYAAEIAALTAFQNIYALMQCTPDISPNDCNFCVRECVSDYQTCCHGKQGGVVSRPSCFFRWDLYPYHAAFDNITSSPPPQLPPSSGNQGKTTKKDNKTISAGTIVAIVVPTVAIISVLLALGCVVCWRRKSYHAIDMGEADAPSSLKFDLSTVQVATNDFSEENKLGEGGFGPVYKGKLPNGQEIAVKRLSIRSGQGEQEFKNEVLLLSRLQRRNLVRLLGYCLKGEERLLIYEFVPNSSLDHLIFDSVKRSLATWDTRYNVIGGIARGLLYLHEDSRLRIIHRDLKPSNILLEDKMNPKISDFGMARLFAADETQAKTSRAMGTYGYMAPEYITQGMFSVKSDVYSFRIMVLEIICGQKRGNFQPNGLPGHAWISWHEGRGLDILDPVIRDGSRSEIMRCIHIGLLCVQENVARRPTMNSVVLWLSSSTASLPVPTTPAFFIHGTVKSKMSSSFQYKSSFSDQRRGEDCQVSLEDASITELEPR